MGQDREAFHTKPLPFSWQSRTRLGCKRNFRGPCFQQGCQKRPTSLVLLRILASCLHVEGLQLGCSRCTLPSSYTKNKVGGFRCLSMKTTLGYCPPCYHTDLQFSLPGLATWPSYQHASVCRMHIISDGRGRTPAHLPQYVLALRSSHTLHNLRQYCNECDIVRQNCLAKDGRW